MQRENVFLSHKISEEKQHGLLFRLVYTRQNKLIPLGRGDRRVVPRSVAVSALRDHAPASEGRGLRETRSVGKKKVTTIEMKNYPKVFRGLEVERRKQDK